METIKIKGRFFIPAIFLLTLCWIFAPPVSGWDAAGENRAASDKAPADSGEALDDFFSDDPADGGPAAELPAELLEPDPVAQEPVRYSLTGSVSFKTGYRYNHAPPPAGLADHQGISDLYAGLDVQFKTRISGSWEALISGSAEYNFLYRLNDRDQYNKGFLDENESDFQADRVFIRGSLTEHLDLAVGRQVVVWGKSDNIRITDVLNPLDFRQLGLTDIEDLRQPVCMTRLGYYFSNLSVSAIMIHERRFNRMPVFGSPYYYLPYPVPADSKPSSSLENTEIAVSLAATFTGFDISVYLADLYDNMAYLAQDGSRRHSRIKMAGTALSKAYGNFLFKAETAFFEGIRLSAVRSGPVLVENFKEYNRLDALVGIEYNGFKNTTVSYEIADRWLTDHDAMAASSGTRENTLQHAARLTRTYLNEVLEVSALVSLFGEKAGDGGFVRIQGDYDITDTLVLTFGVVDYTSGPGFLVSGIGENDLFFLKLERSF